MSMSPLVARGSRGSCGVGRYPPSFWTCFPEIRIPFIPYIHGSGSKNGYRFSGFCSSKYFNTLILYWVRAGRLFLLFVSGIHFTSTTGKVHTGYVIA